MLFVKTKTSKNNYIQSSQIGVEAINRANIERADKLNVVVGDYVHVNWRKEYIHVCYTTELAKKKKKTRYIQAKNPEVHNHHLTLKQSIHFMKTGLSHEKSCQRQHWQPYQNIKRSKSVTESIKFRGFDEWALIVFGRMEGFSDLHAEDAVYHRTCYSNFKTNKKIPSKYLQPDSKINWKRGPWNLWQTL